MANVSTLEAYVSSIVRDAKHCHIFACREYLLESTAAAVRGKINNTRNFDDIYVRIFCVAGNHILGTTFAEPYPLQYNVNNRLVLNDSGTSHMAAVDGS